MTPDQKENIGIISFGFTILILTLTMKWWVSPFVELARLYHGF